eukprot:gene23-397_t
MNHVFNCKYVFLLLAAVTFSPAAALSLRDPSGKKPVLLASRRCPPTALPAQNEVATQQGHANSVSVGAAPIHISALTQEDDPIPELRFMAGFIFVLFFLQFVFSFINVFTDMNVSFDEKVLFAVATSVSLLIVAAVDWSRENIITAVVFTLCSGSFLGFLYGEVGYGLAVSRNFQMGVTFKMLLKLWDCLQLDKRETVFLMVFGLVWAVLVSNCDDFEFCFQMSGAVVAVLGACAFVFVAGMIIWAGPLRI